MSRGMTFWIFSACIVFLLSLVWTYQGFNRANRAFTCWLYLGVLMQLMAAWWLAGGRPQWVLEVRGWLDIVTYALCCASLIVAVHDWHTPVNQTVAMGLAGILALDVIGRMMGPEQQWLAAWLRNVASVGPSIWMLAIFSGARFDRLPLWIGNLLSERCQQAAEYAMAVVRLR